MADTKPEATVEGRVFRGAKGRPPVDIVSDLARCSDKWESIMSDNELLRHFNATGNASSFKEIVARHAHLIYSVAYRITRSTHTAEDVTQGVFLDLLRRARSLGPDVCIVAWLHVVARRASIDVVRRAVSRAAREKASSELFDGVGDTMPWSAIEPVIDEAVESLPQRDRVAILMRFFEDKSFREIGRELGVSEDAAQKRVARALVQLRDFLARRGLPTTAAALAADLEGHAILTIPAVVLVRIGEAVCTGGAIGSVAAGLSVPVIGAQKAVAGIAFVAVLGAGAYLAGLVGTDSERSAAGALSDNRRKFSEISGAAPKTSSLSAAVSAEKGNPAETARPLQRAALLRQLSLELPLQYLPEMRLLEEVDWQKVADSHSLDTASDIRLALADLRALSRTKMASVLQSALLGFTQGSGGLLPTELGQLKPYLGGIADAEMLARYELLRKGGQADPAEKVLREKATSDMILSVGMDGSTLVNNAAHLPALGEDEVDALERAWSALGTAYGEEMKRQMATMGSPRVWSDMMARGIEGVSSIYGDSDAAGEAMKKSVRTYLAANPGAEITDLAQVLPYLEESERLVAALRPVFAQMAYTQEHQGQAAPDAAALEPYLRRPFDASKDLRVLKLKWDGQTLSMNWSFGVSMP